MPASGLPAIREVASPLTDAMLAPLDQPFSVVQFKSLLTDADFGRLADLLCKYPTVTLRAYASYDDTIKDLEFLRFFPFHSIAITSTSMLIQPAQVRQKGPLSPRSEVPGVFGRSDRRRALPDGVAHRMRTESGLRDGAVMGGSK